MQTTRLLQAGLMGLLCCIPMGVVAQESKDGQHRDEDVVLREVVVTGTGTEHLLKNAPVQTEVITRKMLENYGGRSIEEILSGLTASFSFAEGDMGSQMQLNGLGNNYILILIDGKRIHGDNGGENDLGLIDPNNIERIEIVKGAQSALYGSDAIAGVVNIITRKRKATEGEQWGLDLTNTTRYGSHNDIRQHNSVGLNWRRLESITSFQLQHNDGWQNTAQQYAEAQLLPDTKTKTANRFTNWQLGEKLWYQATQNLELTAGGTYYRKDILRPTDGKYPSCDVYTYDLTYCDASASVGGKMKLGTGRKENDYIALDADWNKHAYYYSYTARTYEDAYVDGVLEHGIPFYAGQRRLQSDQQRVMVTAKGVFDLPANNTLNAGLEYRYDLLEAPMRTENGQAHDMTTALYAQDEYDVAPWLNITGGARLIYNGNFGLHFTPKLSTMVSLGDLRWRAGWSQGFKSPTVKELNYRYLHVMGASTFFYMGNKDLKPQTSNYWSTSLEYRKGPLVASVTGYFNKLDNMITLVNVSPDEIPKDVTTAYLGDGSGGVTARMYRNMEDARTWGLDVNLSYKLLRDLTLTCNYAYLDTKAHVFDSKSERLTEVVIDGMAHNKWNVSLMYGHSFSPSYRLGASIAGRGSSERYYENNGNGRAFHVWRLNTTHDFGRRNKPLSYRLEVGVDNIFNFRDTTPHPYHLGTNTPGTTFNVAFSIKFHQGKKINNKLTINQKKNEED